MAGGPAIRVSRPAWGSSERGTAVASAARTAALRALRGRGEPHAWGARSSGAVGAERGGVGVAQRARACRPSIICSSCCCTRSSPA
eukprot:3242029-Prymnesium_polylepis.1